MCFTNDNKYIISYSTFDNLYIFDVNNDKLVNCFEGVIFEKNKVKHYL